MFFLRKRLIQASHDLVDAFVAPSRFLLERYVSWGIPRERIVLEENGSSARPPLPDARRPGPPKRFGFFGQLTPFKGADVLLQAMARAVGDGLDAHLWLHGSNLERQPSAYRARLEELLAE